MAILLLSVGAALPWFAPATLKGRWIGALLFQLLSLLISTVFSSRAGLSILGTNWRRYGFTTQASLLLITALAAEDLADADLTASLADKTLPARLRRYASPDLLIIDEFGFDKIERDHRLTKSEALYGAGYERGLR